jgi:uncharacterized membrane protein
MRVWTSVAIAACCALSIAISAPASAQPAPGAPAPGGGGGGGGPGAPGGGGGPGGPGGGGGNSPNFTLSVCNKSGVKNVFMAFTSLKDAKNWHVHGWYKVPDTGCGKLGDFPKDTIYYFAVDGALNVSWSGEGTQQCVNPTKAFDYNQPTQGGGAPHQCTAEEVMVGFDVIKTQPNTQTFELTLQ